MKTVKTIFVVLNPGNFFDKLEEANATFIPRFSFYKLHDINENGFHKIEVLADIMTLVNYANELGRRGVNCVCQSVDYPNSL